jgi:hypothetical protein
MALISQQRYELRWRWKDGSTVWCRYSTMPLLETLKMAIEDECDIHILYVDGRRELFWRNSWMRELET